MKRVLFVSEAVTLAQVVRLRVLAGALDRGRYDVHFASARFDPMVFDDDAQLTRWHIDSLSPGEVERAVARGGRIYSRQTLERYTRDDIALIEKTKPDLIVGDLRWSLTVAAPHCKVPLAALINAYWSPYAQRESFPVPDHPIVSVLGEKLTERYFPQALPRVMRHFVAPLNAVRRDYGLAPIPDLLEMLSFGDYVLHPDIPELTPTQGAPASHRFLGPVLWAPKTPCHELDTLGMRRPLVYLTLGSSGRVASLDAVLRGLSPLDVDVLVASADRAAPDLPANARLVRFAPGDLVARRASLVVCNGGSTTGYQALAAGCPVLGIASNLDQHLAMQAISRAGAGKTLRATGVRADDVSAAADAILKDASFKTAAQRLAAQFATYDWRARFAAFAEEATTQPAPAPPQASSCQ